MEFFFAFILALSLSVVLTPWVRRFALNRGIVDKPGGRKIHSRPVAYMGGLAIYAAFTLTVLVHFVPSRQLIGLLGGITVLLIVGLIDDVRNLSPYVKLFWQFVAAAIALSGGIGITTLTNPIGGVIHLNAWRFPVHLGPLFFHISPVANILSLLWMVVVINAINFLDGLDGLACGVSGIAGLIIFLLAISPRVNQPEVALLAIILTGACLGFLPYNFFPAKIFMGDSGAYSLGLTLALLAVYSGAKLATAALVLGFTLIDFGWAVLRRLYNRRSPFSSDRGHLHHLLLEVGLSQRKAVLGLYLLSLTFGSLALITGSFAKLIILGILALFMATLITSLVMISRRRGLQVKK